MDNTEDSTRVEELHRCADSFIYFCETYIKIRHPNKGLIPFTLYDYQKRYIEAISNNQFVIASKFRQAGFSTLNVAWAVWRCIFKLNECIMFNSKTNHEVYYLSDIAKHMISELPDWLQPKLSKNSDHQKLFENTNCKLLFYTPEPAKGRALNYVFIDEAAFIPNMDKNWKAIWPTISCGGKCIVVSNPNGINNWYYEIYQRAKKNGNDFYVFEADYWEHPDYNNPEWIKNKRTVLGEKGWRQEIRREFLPEKEDVPVCPMLAWSEKLTNIIKDNKDSIELVGDKQEKIIKESASFDQLLEKKAESYIKRQERDGYHYPKNSAEEQKLLCELKKNFLEDPKNAHLFNKIGEIKDNDKPPVLIGDKNQETCKLRLKRADMCTQISDYWHSDDAADIAEEQIHVLDDMTLANHLKQKDFDLEQLDRRVTEDLLVLSGIMDSDDLDNTSCSIADDGTTPMIEILSGIRNSKIFPDELTVDFKNKQFCVNNASTNIKEFDVMCLYNGLASFTSPEKAVKKVVEVICSRMKPLFEMKITDGSNEKPQIKKKKLCYK